MNKTLLCSALVLSLCGGASAETVYRHVDAEGNVTYTSTPPATGEKAEVIEVDTQSNVLSSERTPELERLEEEERQRYWQRQQDTQREQVSRESEREAAEARLRRAREAREAGQALRPGDLMGRKDGGTRPSQQRTERLQRLDAEVKAAEEELERVRSGG